MRAVDLHSISAIGGSTVRAVIIWVRAKASQLNAPDELGKVRPHAVRGPFGECISKRSSGDFG